MNKRAMQTPVDRKLTIKQKKFVALKVAGKKNAEAYIEAGYSANTRNVAEAEASRLTNKPNIQAAIDKALEHHGATPEFAVGRLKQIAEQEEEIGAARLAAKDILELHGWRKDQRPTVSLTFKSSFFNASRNKGQDNVVEGEVVQD